MEPQSDNWCSQIAVSVDTKLIRQLMRVKSSSFSKPPICNLTSVWKDTHCLALRPLSSTGPLLTLCCSSAVKYPPSTPFCSTPVDLVILGHLQPLHITAVITSVLCFALPPCTLSGDLVESCGGKQSEKLCVKAEVLHLHAWSHQTWIQQDWECNNSSEDWLSRPTALSSVLTY